MISSTTRLLACCTRLNAAIFGEPLQGVCGTSGSWGGAADVACPPALLRVKASQGLGRVGIEDRAKARSTWARWRVEGQREGGADLMSWRAG